MRNSVAILVLLLAATLEVGGDAIVRVGLHSSGWRPRLLIYLLAAAVLFAYGWTVNAPGWDFGRLLGLYVVLFFIVAQLVSWVGFDQPPSRAVLIGGALIVSGGLVIVGAQ
jgi:small multidrug resistance family-3 protein